MRIILLCFALACASLPVMSQQRDGYRLDLSGFDAAMMLAGAEEVMLRASDQDLDGLYQAVLAAAGSDAEAQLLCELFDPSGDRSLAGLQRVANGLGPASRARFADAAVAIAVAGMQNPIQPYDPAAADRILRRAGVTAMLLHDDFATGIAATGTDPDNRQARCRAFRQLVDVLQDFEPAERAAATRHLMLQGLTRHAPETQ